MNADATRIRPRAPSVPHAAIVGVVLAIAWIAHALYGRAAADEQLGPLQQELDVRQAMVVNASALKVQLAELELMLAQSRERLPAKFDQAQIRRDLDESAATRGVEIVAVQFAPEALKEFYAELPVKLTVRGPGPALYAFVAELSDAEPVRHVGALTLQPADEQRSAMTAEIVATMFRYVEDGDNERSR